MANIIYQCSVSKVHKRELATAPLTAPNVLRQAHVSGPEPSISAGARATCGRRREASNLASTHRRSGSEAGEPGTSAQPAQKK